MSATALPSASRRVPAQLVRFGLVGATNTIITLIAYTLIAAIAPAAAAAALGWAVGAVNGYRLNRAWTFASAVRGAAPAARYTGVQAVAAAVNAGAVWLLVANGHATHLVAELVGLPAASALAFVLCRWWVFA
jgi:putative flippase GtrA